MIRVLHILPQLDIGGAELGTVELAKRMHGKDFEIKIVSLFPPLRGVEKRLDAAGIPWLQLGKRPGPDPRMYAALDRALRDFAPQVIHTHLYVLRYALPAIFRRRIPVRVHSVWTLAHEELGWAFRLLQRLAFAAGVIPVAVSKAVGQTLMNTYGIPNPHIIHTGITMDNTTSTNVNPGAWRMREGIPADSVVFACIARLAPPKNQELLLDAVAKAFQGEGGVRLILAGDGTRRASLEERARRLGIAGRVHFLGFRQDVRDILAASDVFVLCSDLEGYPLSIMEAMAAGRAVAATAVGGIPELIENGKSGLLVPPRSEPELARALLKLAQDAGLRKKLGKAAAQAAQRFNISKTAEKYGVLYRTLLLRYRQTHGRH